MRLLSITEVAKMTGRTERTIWGWRYRKGLPTVQIGSRIFIDEDDFSLWLELKKRKPRESVLRQFGLSKEEFKRQHIVKRKKQAEHKYEGLTVYDRNGNVIVYGSSFKKGANIDGKKEVSRV